MDFNNVYAIDVNEFAEKKGNLTYLSWAHAWREFKKVYPQAKYRIIKENGLAYFGNEKHGYMVYTEVTVDDLTHEMWLPVMDHRNKSVMNPTTFDINKTIMRCLTKNLAMFGLGLYIYAGEDLPQEPETGKTKPNSTDMKALIALAKRKGIDMAEYAKENNIHSKDMTYTQFIDLKNYFDGLEG